MSRRAAHERRMHEEMASTNTPPSHESVPSQPEELSTEWLTKCFRCAGVLDSGQVTSFTLAPLGAGIGFAGRLKRVTLEYDNPLPHSPKTVIAKFVSPRAFVRELMVLTGGYDREIRFYDELAADVGIPTPRAYFAHYDPDRVEILLLLEDLAPAAHPDIETGLTLDQARTVMECLAVLHASWWGRTAQVPWLAREPEFETAMRERYLVAMGDYLAESQDIYPAVASVVRNLGVILDGMPPRERLSEAPGTLIHNDLHPANLFLPRETGGRPTIIDWQSLDVAPDGMCDVTRVLCTGLPEEVRRAHATELLQHYRDKLLENGGDDFSFRRMQRRYGEEVVSLVMATVLTFRAVQPEDEMQREAVAIVGRRIEAAVADAGVARALTIFALWSRLRRRVRRIRTLLFPQHA